MNQFSDRINREQKKMGLKKLMNLNGRNFDLTVGELAAACNLDVFEMIRHIRKGNVQAFVSPSGRIRINVFESRKFSKKYSTGIS